MNSAIFLNCFKRSYDCREDTKGQIKLAKIILKIEIYNFMFLYLKPVVSYFTQQTL